MRLEERVKIIDGQICLNDSDPDNVPWVLWRDNFQTDKDTAVELIRDSIRDAEKDIWKAVLYLCDLERPGCEGGGPYPAYDRMQLIKAIRERATQ